MLDNKNIYYIAHIDNETGEKWFLTNQSVKTKTWWTKCKIDENQFTSVNKAYRKLKDILFKNMQYYDIQYKNESYILYEFKGDQQMLKMTLTLQKEKELYKEYYKKLMEFAPRAEREPILKKILELKIV